MKYLNQKRYPDVPYIVNTDDPDDEYGKNATIASSGCGLCSAVMVADRLLVDPKFGLDEAIALSYEVGANHFRGTDFSLFVPAFAEKMGLKYEVTDDPDALRNCLRTGGAAIAHCRVREGYVSLFTKFGHYIAVIAEQEDGRIVCLDPSYEPGKYDKPGAEGTIEVKDEAFSICDMDLLVKETLAKSPRCFYLFWRK